VAEASTIYDYMCANATLLGVRILEQFPALHQVQDPLSPVSRNCKSGNDPRRCSHTHLLFLQEFLDLALPLVSAGFYRAAAWSHLASLKYDMS
jgi:hypothetical protein